MHVARVGGLDFDAPVAPRVPAVAWRITYGDGSTRLVMARTRREAVERAEANTAGEWAIRVECLEAPYD